MSNTTAPRVALTRDEAAAAVGTSKDRIDKAINAGQLKAKRDGRAVRIKLADLEAWFDSWSDA